MGYFPKIGTGVCGGTCWVVSESTASSADQYGPMLEVLDGEKSERSFLVRATTLTLVSRMYD